MKRLIMIIAIGTLFAHCNNSSDSDAGADTTVPSITPPPTKDTNPIGIMMGDTTIGLNDSLRKDSLK